MKYLNMKADLEIYGNLIDMLQDELNCQNWTDTCQPTPELRNIMNSKTKALMRYYLKKYTHLEQKMWRLFGHI